MKSINVYFDDNEFELLSNAKGEDSWHDFMMVLVEPKKKVKP